VLKKKITMETVKRKIKIAEVALFISVSTLFILLGVISFIFHISPEGIINALADFEEHHYFIISYSSLLIGLISFKKFLNSIEPKEIKSKSKSKRLTSLSKISNVNFNTKEFNPESFVRVDKSEIINSSFNNIEEVLTEYKLIEKRKFDINRSVILGNLFKHKVEIYFKDSDSLKRTSTTIWHADELNISLKGGITIPVKNIFCIVY
jgi:hypothetical protein